MEKLLAQKAKLEAVVAEAKKALIAANVELSEFLKTYYYVDESHFSLTKITEPTP